jgi:hypothetical protein
MYVIMHRGASEVILHHEMIEYDLAVMYGLKPK